MKKHIILLLKTLINNNACVEAARTREKKYNIFPVVFAVVALFLACLPICITGFQVQGQNWVNTTNNIDDGLYRFGEMNKSSTVKMKIIEKDGNKNKHEMVFENGTWENIAGVGATFDNITGYNHRAQLDKLTAFTYEDQGTKLFEVFYYDGNVHDVKTNKDLTFAEFYTYIAGNVNPYNTDQCMRVTRKDDGSIDTKLARNNAFMVFSKDQFFGANFNLKGSGTTTGSMLFDYDHTKVGTDILHDFFDEAGHQAGTLTKWKGFFNEGYINIRHNNTWRSTYIVLGINGGVLIFMGFMVWVLTRGKNNPFRIYTFWDSEKIAMYASLTPGILSLIGFISSSLAMMLFVLCCGVRVMWLSMRTLRYTAPQK